MSKRVDTLLLLAAMGLGCSFTASDCDPPKPGPNDFNIAEPANQTDVPPPGGVAGDPPIRRHLGDDECIPSTTNPSGDAFKTTIQAMRTLPTGRESTINAEPFVLLWNVCNRTKVATTASSYSLVIERSTRDTSQPPLLPGGVPNISYTPLTPSLPLTASPVTMTLPALPACSCLIQVVGVNRDAPADAAASADAENITGAVFPRIEVAPLIDTGTLLFGHRFSLSNAPIQINPNLTTVKSL